MQRVLSLHGGIGASVVSVVLAASSPVKPLTEDDESVSVALAGLTDVQHSAASETTVGTSSEAKATAFQHFHGPFGISGQVTMIPEQQHWIAVADAQLRPLSGLPACNFTYEFPPKCPASGPAQQQAITTPLQVLQAVVRATLRSGSYPYMVEVLKRSKLKTRYVSCIARLPYQDAECCDPATGWKAGMALSNTCHFQGVSLLQRDSHQCTWHVVVGQWCDRPPIADCIVRMVQGGSGDCDGILASPYCC